MSGTFPGVSGVQQIDSSGTPLKGAQLSVFNGGTNDLSLTYQDIGLSIPAANPLTADDSGRIPLFFVADGTYKVRLVDRFGDITNGGFEYPQVPSIGASSSGGGGTAVDPTTVLSTGDIKATLIPGTLSGFVRMNGRTIGSAVSGASERAAADAQALFLYLWTNFTNLQLPVLGGRGTSALNDWTAAKQITLPDMRARAVIGVDDMGNAAAGRFNGGLIVSGDELTPYSIGGEAAHLLVKAELPSSGQTIIGHHTHQITPMNSVSTVVQAGSGNAFTYYSPTGGASLATQNDSNVVLSALGSDTNHNNLSPFALCTWYMKL